MQHSIAKSDRYLKMHALAILPILNGLTPDEIQRLFRLIEQHYLFQHVEEVLPPRKHFCVDKKTHEALILQWGKEFKQDNSPVEQWENKWLQITTPENSTEAEKLINLIQRRCVAEVQ